MARAVARTAPLAWPAADALLPRLRADASLLEVPSPIYTPCRLDAEGSEGVGRSYVRVCPKFEIRAFQPRSWTPAIGPGRLRLQGAVYFSRATAGAPGCVHGGAVTTALDCIASDMPMKDRGYDLIYVTRSFSVTFARFVPVDAVCRFECWIEPASLEDGGEADGTRPRRADSVVRCRLFTAGEPSALHAECLAVMAAAGPLPEGLQRRVEFLRAAVEAGRPYHEAVVEAPAPASDEGWWPPPARRLVGRMERAERGLSLADMERDFPAMQIDRSYAASPGQTFWESVPGTSVYWDVGRAGASADLAGAAVKVVRRLLWRGAKDTAPGAAGVLGVVLFTQNAMGPPGRAHGGAVGTAFDDAMGQLTVRQVGFMPAMNTVELSIDYLRATPLGVPLVIAARLKWREGRLAGTEAVLLEAEDWPPEGGEGELWTAGSGRGRGGRGPRVCARATAQWKQARPESLGLEKAIDYDEALLRFGGPGGSGTPEALRQAQERIFEKRAKL